MQSFSFDRDASFDQPSSLHLPDTATVSHFDLTSLIDKDEQEERNGTPEDDTLKSIQRRMVEPQENINNTNISGTDMESENLSQRLIQEINFELAKGNQESSYSSNQPVDASYSFDISKTDVLDKQFDSFIRNEIVNTFLFSNSYRMKLHHRQRMEASLRRSHPCLQPNLQVISILKHP